jgi:hypothetical protein
MDERLIEALRKPTLDGLAQLSSSRNGMPGSFARAMTIDCHSGRRRTPVDIFEPDDVVFA